MTTESLLVKTQDNHIIVFNISFTSDAEKISLSQECERMCERINYADFNSGMIHSAHITFDEKNTSFLREEISGHLYPRKASEYTNGLLHNNFPPAVQKPNTLHFNYIVADSAVPEMIKSIGYKIEPVDELFDVEFDSAAGEYKIKDFKTRLATVYHSERRMEIARKHFRFNKADYARLQLLITKYQNEKAANPKLDARNYMIFIANSKDRSLFKIYANEQYRVEHQEAVIAHEFKHIKNDVLSSGLGLKKNSKRLSVENMYKISVEDERSAYIEQMFSCINAYLKKGDYNDFTMFDNDNTSIVEELKVMTTDDEKIRYLTDIPTLLAKKWREFEDSHREFYDKTSQQFKKNVANLVCTASLSVPEDVDEAEYHRLRSLFYRYKIYNPITKKKEYLNLSSYITPDKEVTIPPEIMTEIIEPQKAALEKRLKKYNNKVHSGDINPRLVEVAKTLLRKDAENTAFINEVDMLRISRLFDDTLPPPVTPTPSPATPTADDVTKWEELRAYWQRSENYSEILCNKDEYSFSLNETTIRYTNQNEVSISKNAEYENYVKLINAPGSQKNKIEFMDTLSPEQALTLYIVCVNNGRTMSGNVPTDLSGVDRLSGIPAAEIAKFRSLTAGTPTTTSAIHSGTSGTRICRSFGRTSR